MDLCFTTVIVEHDGYLSYTRCPACAKDQATFTTGQTRHLAVQYRSKVMRSCQETLRLAIFFLSVFALLQDTNHEIGNLSKHKSSIIYNRHGFFDLIAFMLVHVVHCYVM